MRLSRAWGAYSYSLAAIVWAGTVMAAIAFGFVSSLHHAIWILAMPHHAMAPLWLWAVVGVSGIMLVVLWYRIIAAMMRSQIQRRHLLELIGPYLRPFPSSVPGPLAEVADWFMVDDHDERYAFTWGLGRGRVAISRSLWQALDESARTAVMYHEAAHALARDPFQQALLQILSEAFKPLGMGSLYRRYLVQREIYADQTAVRAFQGDDLPLLTALKAAVESAPSLPSHVGLAGALEARIQFLTTQQPMAWSDMRLRFRFYASGLAVLVTIAEGILVWCHW